MSKTYTLDDLARLVDHTNLHADATEQDMKKLCDEARAYHFKMVAVNQVQSKFCSEQLAGTDIHTGAAIAFPLGQTSIEFKVAETEDAIANGATEIDYVINITQVKAKNWAYLEDEMARIVEVCDKAQVPSKVIFEIASRVKPTFVKTSTGFSTGGATVADVELMASHVGPDVQVKAAGGIRDADTFLDMVRAGATRIGTSSGISIIEALKARMADEGVESYTL